MGSVHHSAWLSRYILLPLRYIFLAAIAFTGVCASQSIPSRTSGKPLPASSSFEAASIRLASPDAPYRSDNDLFGTQAWNGAGLRATAILNVYVLFAYNITDSVQGRALWDSLPSWAKRDKYEIQATAFPGVTRNQVRAMMRDLLAERFSLHVHDQVKQADALMVSLERGNAMKSGLRIHPANQPCLNDPDRPDEIPEPSKGTAAPRYCGVTVWTVEGQRHLQIVDATMPEIATALANESINGGYSTPHAGSDGSGLAGKYDLDLQYVPSENANDAGGPTLKEALQKQAGLKLTERKQPMRIMVVDHLERPTEN